MAERPSHDYSMIRYLASKRSVDDRALNRVVMQALRDEIGALRDTPFRVLELGAGLGNMVCRLWDFGLLRGADYTLLDHDAESLREARITLEKWARALGKSGPAQSRGLVLSYEHSELSTFLGGDWKAKPFHLIVANAVLDLVDLSTVLPLLWNALVPGGFVWLTINFDGETIFLPELPFDRQVMLLYHRSMDRRMVDGRPSGSSQTGRRLLELLPACGGNLVAVGSSDWVVWPNQRRYVEDEAYFLHHIVRTIDLELRAHPELEPPLLEQWVQTRHEQIEAGELTYIAHQLDVLGRAP